jgi:hypothetical protein
MAAALLLGFTGASMAAMSNLELYMVVYTSTGSVETITDLGTIGEEIDLSSQGLVLSSVDALSDLSVYGDGTTYSNLRVAYFALNNTSSTDEAWVTGDTTRLSRGFTNYIKNFTYVATYYSDLDEGETLIGTKSGTGINSYYYIMDSNGTSPGTFGNFSLETNGEVSLATLASVGYVDQILYYYTSTGSTTGVVAAVIRTYANGDVVINPVPVPPGLLLLAPGLLGLIGLRKRFTRA